jgi:co-chaperonin GroES (HSP10)
MQPVFNKIFVQIDKKFRDEVSTDSGIVFYKDTSYALEDNSTTFGTVVAIPVNVDKNLVDKDFVHNVQVGDKLYFNFNVVLDSDNLIEHEGQEYWIVDYWNAICIVRDGVVIPTGSYILISPVEEEIKSDLIVIPDIAKKKEKNRGIVWSTNCPDLPVGSEVEYDAIGKFWNVIEGKRVYCMFNDNISLKFN